MNTTVQPSLFGDLGPMAPLQEAPMQEGATIEERFQAFHAANPQVYDLLCKLALNMRRRGRKRYGIKGLFEVARWHYHMQTTGDEFKINNSYTAFYSRELMKNEPELDGFFETREQRFR